jgi:hypothetical protein
VAAAAVAAYLTLNPPTHTPCKNEISYYRSYEPVLSPELSPKLVNATRPIISQPRPGLPTRYPLHRDGIWRTTGSVMDEYGRCRFILHSPLLFQVAKVLTVYMLTCISGLQCPASSQGRVCSATYMTPKCVNLSITRRVSLQIQDATFQSPRRSRLLAAPTGLHRPTC